MESIKCQLYLNQLNELNNKNKIIFERTQYFNQNKHNFFKKIDNNAQIQQYLLHSKNNEFLINEKYIPKINSMKDINEKKIANFQNFSTNQSINENNYWNQIYSLKDVIKNDYNLKSEELSYFTKIKNICNINPSSAYGYHFNEKNENSNQNSFTNNNPNKNKNKTNIGVFNNYYYNNYLLNSSDNFANTINGNRKVKKIKVKYYDSNENSTEINDEKIKNSSFKFKTNYSIDQYDNIDKSNTNMEEFVNIKNKYYKKSNNEFSQIHSSQNIKKYKNIRNFIAHLEILLELILKRMLEYFIYKIIIKINNDKKNNKFENILPFQKSQSPIIFRNNKLKEIPEIKIDTLLNNSNKIYIPKKKLNNNQIIQSNVQSKIKTNINSITVKEEEDNKLKKRRNKMKTTIRELNIKFNKKFKIKSTQNTPHDRSFLENNISINDKSNSNKDLFSNTVKNQRNTDENIYKKKINSAKKNIYIRAYKNNQITRNNMNKYQQIINYEDTNDINNELNNQNFNNTTTNNKNNFKKINLQNEKKRGNKIKNIVIKNKNIKTYPIKKTNLDNLESFIIKDIITDDKKLFVNIKYVYLSDFYYKNKFDIKNIKISFGANIFIVDKKIFVITNKNCYSQYLSCSNIKNSTQNNNIYLFDSNGKKMKRIDNSLLKNKSQKVLIPSYQNNISSRKNSQNIYYSTNNNLIINKIYCNNNRISANKYKNINSKQKFNYILFLKRIEEILLKNQNTLICYYKEKLIYYLKNKKMKFLLYHITIKNILRRYFQKYRNIIIRKNKNGIITNFNYKNHYPKKGMFYSNNNTININKQPLQKYNHITLRSTNCGIPLMSSKKKLITYGLKETYCKNISKNNNINDLPISFLIKNTTNKYRTTDRSSRNCELNKTDIHKTFMKENENDVNLNTNKYLIKIKNRKLEILISMIDNVNLISSIQKVFKIWKNSGR